MLDQQTKILTPKNAETVTIATISVSQHADLKIEFPEKHDGFREIVKEQLLCKWSWDASAWIRSLDCRAEPHQDRLIEASHTLLVSGFRVEVDVSLAESVVNGRYTPERRRWLELSTNSKFLQFYMAQWGDPVFQELKRLPCTTYDAPYMLMPLEWYETAIDICEEWGVFITDDANQAMQKQEDVYTASLIDIDRKEPPDYKEKPEKKEGFPHELLDD